MPTCRRKRVLLTEPSPALLDALKNDPNREVFYLADTGEIFENYEYVHNPCVPPQSMPDCFCNPSVHMRPGCPSIDRNSSNAR